MKKWFILTGLFFYFDHNICLASNIIQYKDQDDTEFSQKKDLRKHDIKEGDISRSKEEERIKKLMEAASRRVNERLRIRK